MRGMIWAVIVAFAGTGRTYAQSSDSETIAEQLFKQAREFAQAGNWTEACPRFEASLRSDPALGTRLNLATCYEHIGKLATAWVLYREATEIAKKVGDAKRRDYAQKQAVALEPRLPRLAIQAPAKRPTGLVVKRDGTQIDAGALGVPLYIDPGTHEITASAPGFEAFAHTVTVVEGKTQTVAIPSLTPLAMAITSPPVAAAQDRAATRTNAPAQNHAVSVNPVPPPRPPGRVADANGILSSRGRRYIAIGAGAAGVVSVGIGLLFGAKADSDFNKAKSLCGTNLVCSTDDYAMGKQLTRDARSNATTSTVFVAIGGAAAVAGIVVFLTARNAGRERVATRIVPVASDRSTGLMITGRF